MDTLSHRLANALVGNPDEAATLECTVLGPELIFGRDSLVALYGAEFSARTASTPFPLAVGGLDSEPGAVLDNATTS